HLDAPQGIAQWSTNEGLRNARPSLSDMPEVILKSALSRRNLAILSTKDLRTWDLQKGGLPRIIPLEDTQLPMAFVPGSSLLGMAAVSVVLEDVASGAVIRRWDSEAAVVQGFAMDPHGRYIASAGFGKNSIRLWDVKTGDEVIGLTDLPSDVEILAFSQTGDMLAGSLNSSKGVNEIAIWRVPDLTPVTKVVTAASETISLAFDWGQAFLVRLTNAGTLQFYELPTGKLREEGSAANCNSLAMSPDGRFVACGGRDQPFIRLWNSHTGATLLDLFPFGSSDWVVKTPDDHFDASPNALGLLKWVDHRKTRLWRIVIPPMIFRISRPATILRCAIWCRSSKATSVAEIALGGSTGLIVIAEWSLAGDLSDRSQIGSGRHYY